MPTWSFPQLAILTEVTGSVVLTRMVLVLAASTSATKVCLVPRTDEEETGVAVIGEMLSMTAWEGQWWY